MHAQPSPVDLASCFDALTFLPDRVPTMEDSPIRWADTVAQYRDGGILLSTTRVHHNGNAISKVMSL